MYSKKHILLDEACKREEENFLYNVLWIRKHYGISKEKMTRILEIGMKSLNKIESGVMPPRLSAKIIVKIYNNFGILSEDMFKNRFHD